MDYHKIILKCRVCLAEEDENDMHELFPKYLHQNDANGDDINATVGMPRLCEKVEFCCGVRIRESAEMPTKICFKCFDLTRMWYNFRQICLNSQVYFESSCQDDSAIPNEIRDTLKTENDILEYLLEDLQSFRNEMRQTYAAFANEVANIAAVSDEDELDDNDGDNTNADDDNDDNDDTKLFEQIEITELGDMNDDINGGNELIEIKTEIMDDVTEDIIETEETVVANTTATITTTTTTNAIETAQTNVGRQLRKVGRPPKVTNAGTGTNVIGNRKIGGLKVKTDLKKPTLRRTTVLATQAANKVQTDKAITTTTTTIPTTTTTITKQIKTTNTNTIATGGNAQKKNSIQNKHFKSFHKKLIRPSSPTSFMCSICGNVYNKKSSFSYHMSLHKNIKPHECEICGKAFRQVCELRNHMRRHTGEKPFKCAYCDRHFIDRSEKLRHERVHTNTRPYVCQVCGKSFMHSAILKNHTKLHSGEKDFNCLVCQKAFTLQHQLKAHLSTITHKQKEQQFLSAGYEVVYE